jgi:hypothetical protein
MKHVILIAAGAALVATSVGARVLYQAGGDPSPTHRDTPGQPLRDKLVVCVETAPTMGSGMTAAVTTQIAASVAAAVASPAGVEFGLNAFQPEVVAGCPDGYVPPDPDVGRDPGLPPIRRGVKEPLETSTLVFVVSEDEEKFLEPYGGVGRRDYESMCDGQHTCWGVTTALYISPALLDSDEDLFEAVLVGLGVSPTRGDPEGHPPEWKPSPKAGDP